MFPGLYVCQIAEVGGTRVAAVAPRLTKMIVITSRISHSTPRTQSELIFTQSTSTRQPVSWQIGIFKLLSR